MRIVIRVAGREHSCLRGIRVLPYSALIYLNLSFLLELVQTF